MNNKKQKIILICIIFWKEKIKEIVFFLSILDRIRILPPSISFMRFSYLNFLLKQRTRGIGACLGET